MIPFVATVAIQNEHSRSYRFWIPLGIVWLLLLPILLLLFPFFCLACLAIRIRPFDTLSIFGQILGGLKGADLQVERPNGSVEVRLL